MSTEYPSILSFLLACVDQKEKELVEANPSVEGLSAVC